MSFGVLLRWLKANDGSWRRVAMPSLLLRINTFKAEDHTSIHHTTAVEFKRSTLSTSALLRSYYTLGAASQISQTSHSTHQPHPVPALTIRERVLSSSDSYRTKPGAFIDHVAAISPPDSQSRERTSRVDSRFTPASRFRHERTLLRLPGRYWKASELRPIERSLPRKQAANII